MYNDYFIKSNYGYNFNSYDMKWNQNTISMIIMFAILCGIISSVAGIGGGIIYAPFLLAINLHPNVSTSTATLFNFFSSLSNAIFAVLSNQVYYNYASWLIIWTSLGTIAGFWIFKDIIQRTHKTSMVVFLLVVVLLFSTFMTVVNDFRDMEVDINNPGKSLSLRSF